MSTKRMLIDATHPEEARVAIADGTRLEDFDVEYESRRPLKGNIYLAKVTRVEPSLQACFVDYGGNRHGFLAFSEIHPDYYQIPVADREALIAEQQAEEASEGIEDDAEGEDAPVETLGGDDTEEVPVRRPAPRRNYKIQEVIKRRQILLIQVVKEERGNKGAALTTYLSLAGRYCVLMPNTARGGGISRKISNGTDRKRLKKIVGELDIAQGMAVIVRTAGSKRTKTEINRDYTYLIRLWSQVRETTLNSIAPCLVYEEGDIIKRAIRDLYTKEIEEILICGADAYKKAKDFMKLLIPSHAKKVKKEEDGAQPLFQRYQIEHQLNAMHSPTVQLRSGGYIVINPTEALVSVDVNSGKATRERNIEETALRTNLEAADEVARQLKLRDLAGLVVIDFIDMEVNRNQIRVERAVKDAMRNDRARIQVGRISPFGLLELSRQRLRPSFLESSSQPCPHCGGTGVMRSIESTALQMLRVLEEEGGRKLAEEVSLYVPTAVALYIFNNKRSALAEMEERHGFVIRLENDDSLIPPDYRLERVLEDGRIETVEQEIDQGDDDDGGRKRRRKRSRRRGRRVEDGASDETQEGLEEDQDVDADAATAEDVSDDTERDDDEDGEARPRRRRRGRRGGRRRRGERNQEAQDAQDTSDDGATDESDSGESTSDDEAVATEPVPAEKPKRTRRGRKKVAAQDASGTSETPEPVEAEGTAVAAEALPKEQTETAEEDAPKKPRRRRRTKAEDAPTSETPEVPEADAAAQPSEKEKPKRRSRKKAAHAEPEAAEPVATPKPEPEIAAAAAASEPATPEGDVAVIEPEKPVEDLSKTTVIDVDTAASEQPKKRGWWKRLVE